MNVIYDGRIGLPTKRIYCLKCRSQLEYTELDVKEDCHTILREWFNTLTNPFDGLETHHDNYVECPVCNNKIYLGGWIEKH